MELTPSADVASLRRVEPLHGLTIVAMAQAARFRRHDDVAST
jgi:hypothetical protein